MTSLNYSPRSRVFKVIPICWYLYAVVCNENQQWDPYNDNEMDVKLTCKEMKRQSLSDRFSV